MRRNHLSLYGLSLSVLLMFTGCTTVSRQESFLGIKGLVRDRTGKDVIWNTNAEEDREVSKLIGTKLRGQLSLADCIQIALLSNPKLQSKYEDLGVAQAELVQAGLLKNPLLDLSRRFPGQAAEVDLIQDFLQIFFIPLKRQLSEAMLETAKMEVAHAVVSEVSEVKDAYFHLQAELQVLEMRRSIVVTSEGAYVAAKELKRAGNSANLELQNEAAMLARAKLDLAEVEASIIESREKLNVLMGAWGENTSWTIAARLPELPRNEIDGKGLEALAVSRRLDLIAAKKRIDSVTIEFGLSRYLTILPEISVGGHFEREPEGGSTTGPSLAIPLPIFDWGRAASLRGAAELRRALRDYEALAIQVRSDVRSAYGRMISARNRAEYFFREVLPVQKRVLQETQLLYNGMYVGVFHLLQAKQAQINSGRDYIDSVMDYWLARTELENAIGGAISTSGEEEFHTEGSIEPIPAPSSKVNHSHHHGH